MLGDPQGDAAKGALGCKSSLPAQSSLTKWSRSCQTSQLSTGAAHQGWPHGDHGASRAILTETLVGSLGGAASPGPVLVEGLAALAVGAGRVVLAHADQLPGLVQRALTGVAIAFAPAARPQRGGERL